MLVALAKNGERITANKYLKKENEYYCPVCKEKLIFRNGLKRIPHFAHIPNDESTCFMNRGESTIHNAMKMAMKEIIERDNDTIISELEWRIIGRDGTYYIADYYFEKNDKYGKIKKCAVECVYKHDDLPHFLEKNKFYFENNIYPIWVFNSNRFKNKEIRINDILKESHSFNFGKVWALDYKNKEIYAVHFNKVERYVEEKTLIDWDEWDGHSDPSQHAYVVGGYYRTLAKTKQPIRKKIQKFNINSFNYKKADKFLPYNRLVASPFIKCFWR